MSLVKELISPLLEEEKKVVAVYGGGFKPPTAGHFEVVDQALKEKPNIDEFIILIGGKERDGISPEESLIIWDIYKQYLPIKVEVKLSPKPPIQAVYNYAKEHPNEEVLFVIGAREGNEDDFKDISVRTKSLDKYDNLELRTIITQGGASGTAARNAAKISSEKLRPLLPKQLKDEEVEEIFTIMSNVVKENDPEDGKAAPYGSGYKKLNEVLNPSTFDYKPIIKSLTKSMEDDGLQLKPYPKITFIHDEESNAEDFFGKKAYYDPNNNEVVLYTLGRHPKDIMRSYAHELIHVHQNHEDRLDGINTTNVNQDDYLEQIEREAYENGNIMFRSWTNKTLNEGKKKDPFGINAYARELAMGLEEEFNLEKAPEKSVELKTYGDLKLALKNIKKDQNLKKFKDVGGKAFSAALNLIPGVGSAVDAYGVFKAAFNKPDNVKTNTWLDKLDVDDDASKIVDDTVENEFLKVATDKFMSEPDDKELDPNFNMDDELNDHLKKQFNRRHVGGVNEQEEGEHYIYLDMDGVVADFDKRFEDLSGMLPQEYVDKNGLNAFWDLIDEKHKVAFWRGIELMPGAQKLVKFVEQYPFEMLTAPSVKKQSIIGKGLWVKDKVGTLYSTKPKVTYRKAKLKHTVKPQLTKYDILIDDKASTIDTWDNSGGTAILYQSADQVINDLKQLGL